MNIVNILPVDESEILMMSKSQFIYTVILSKDDVTKVQELCEYYGYMICKSHLPSVVQLVKVKA